MKYFALLLLLMSPLPTASAEEQETATEVRFIENGRYKLGVDLSSGASIFWLSEMPDGPNLLNHADRGRFIQQSYYGKEDGSKWVEKPWRWNPVQGGNYLGSPAETLETRVGEGSLYARGVPAHWVTGEILRDCRMEQWITLGEEEVEIRFRFEYRGEEEHPPQHQELPAVFVDSALDRLVYSVAGELKTEVPGWPNEYRDCEEWAAFVGKDDRGLGVQFPGTERITTYRHPGPEGPKGSGCSYFAPIQTLAIKPGFVMDYKIRLIIGSMDEIRAAFGKPDAR